MKEREYMKQITDYLTAYITKSMNLSEHYSIINYTVKTVIEEMITFSIALGTVFLYSGEISSGILFGIIFAVLRKFAGGIHSSTYIGCIFVTTCIFCMNVWLVKNIRSDILLIVALIALGVIWKISPIEFSDRRTNLRQQRKAQYMVRKILILCSCAVLVFYNTEIAITIQTVLIMICVLQLLAKFCSKEQYNFKSLPKEMNVNTKRSISAVVLSVCVFVCQNTIPVISKSWAYQDDIPDDIQRKFDNM